MWRFAADFLQFYLKTQCKHRGYIERQQFDLNIGELDAAIERELARVADKGKD